MEAMDRDLIATATALVRGRGDGLCATLALLPISEDRKSRQACNAVIDPARIAIRGEVLRVYDGCSNRISDGLQLRDLLARDLLANIVGCVKCRFVCTEA